MYENTTYKYILHKYYMESFKDRKVLETSVYLYNCFILLAFFILLYRMRTVLVSNEQYFREHIGTEPLHLTHSTTRLAGNPDKHILRIVKLFIITHEGFVQDHEQFPGIILHTTLDA